MEVDTQTEVVASADDRAVGEEMEADDTRVQGETGEGCETESDSDSSEDEETGLTKRAAELEQQITDNPYMYDSHKALIDVYKSLGELDSLRETRRRFSQLFPLTEDLWLRWINDERELVSTAEEKAELIDLFEKSVQDYLSINLWIEFCTFAIGMGDIDKCREIMSKAVETAGRHLTDGKLLYDLRLEYEEAILATMQPAPGSCPSAEQQKKMDTQTELVDNLYKQLITTPLVGIDSALLEYEEWSGEKVSEELRASHQKALLILESCNKFENELATAQTEETKNKVYTSYITSYVTHHSDQVSCIKCLFERAIVSNCLDQNLWIKYTQYLERMIARESPDTLISVYTRSVRNCPWSGALWEGYSLCRERRGDPLDQLEGLLETALQSGLTTSYDFLAVWRTYCDIIRRKINWANLDQSLLDKLREIFSRATQHLMEYYATTKEEPDYSLLRYEALIEAKHCSNMERCRSIWNDTMAGSESELSQSWLHYATLERQHGDNKHCRRVYQRALKSVTDNPEIICQQYLRFEREEGNIESLYLARNRVQERRDQLATELAKQRKLERKFDNKKPKGDKAGLKKDKKGKPKGKPATDQKQNGATPDGGHKQNGATPDGGHKKDAQGKKINKSANFEPVVYKRKRDDNSKQQQTTQKGSEVITSTTAPTSTEGGGDFKLPAIPTSEPPSKKSKSAAPTDSTVDDTVMTKTDYSNTDDRTVFVSNLSYETTEQQLNDIFSLHGEVKEVRIMKSKGDKSKGFAYVEFTSQEGVAEALKIDRTAIEGRPMFISTCNRKKSANLPKLKYETGMEKCKLFVSGLSFSLTKEDLEKVFSKHGKLKDVRIVTYRGGKSKGLAYVEYYDENEARKALIALDDYELDGFTMKVAISNPPARRPHAVSDPVRSLGGTSKQVIDSQTRGRGRSQLNLLQPRAIQRGPAPSPKQSPAGNKPSTEAKANPPPAEEGSQTKTTAAPAKKLSNNAFRDMFLSKK